MVTDLGQVMGMVTSINEGSCDGYKEGMYVRYLGQCPPSNGWLVNNGHYSNAMSVYGEIRTKC